MERQQHPMGRVLGGTMKRLAAKVSFQQQYNGQVMIHH
jgi:hypothetical protein